MSNNPFLEERLPVCVRLGSNWSDSYAVEVTTTASGQEYRRLVHRLPMRRFTVTYIRGEDETHDQILALYHRAYGQFAGFRVRAFDDWSTNGRTAPPTAFDQALAVVAPGIYQLQKEYGTGAPGIDIGRPVRTIYKPVAGTVLIGIRNLASGDIAATGATTDTTTGRVTFPANKTATITAITQATQAVVTVDPGHGIVGGESVHFSDVTGMTEINGQRALVLTAGPTSITVALNTTAYTAHTSGGALSTRPQDGETVTGGCEFDLPCRFDTAIDVTPLAPDVRETSTIEIVELLNP